MKLIHHFFVVFIFVILSGCVSVNETPSGTVEQKSQRSVTLPSWVTLPLIEDGFSDTQCVRTNADARILKSKATALARAGIARQINVSVKAIEKTYQNLRSRGVRST